MALKAGIVGLPNVGKSTLFNAITNSQVEAANYPFATIEPNVGIVELKDERLDKIAKIINPKKIIHATFEFTDIAGLVEGASKGEGLGNKFLANIREVDAIVQVVRCFEDDSITHVVNSIDPVRDIEIINTELLLADLETINNVIRRVERKATKANDKDAKIEYNVALKLKNGLEKGVFAKKINLSDDELILIKSYQLLTSKPVLYVGNVAEEFVSSPEESILYKKMQDFILKSGDKVMGISAQIEGELAQLSDEDRQVFLNDLGIKKSGLNRLTRSSFELLNLATYFTAGVQEVRAWTFNVGMKAPECAGVIHTDFQKGFIKAEVVAYDDFINFNGEQGAKSSGKYRLEGKEYTFKDGDIANFKFNV